MPQTRGACDACGMVAATRYSPDHGANFCAPHWAINVVGLPGDPPGLRERVARAIADAAGDGVFDRDEPDCTTDDEDRAYWLRLADAAIAASAPDRSIPWVALDEAREADRG